MPFHGREDFLENHGDIYLGATNALHRLEGELDRTRGVDEAPGLKKRVGDIREHLRFLLEADDRNTVFWIERRSAGGFRSATRNTYLQATPIDVSEMLSELLFENYPKRDSHFGNAHGAVGLLAHPQAAWDAGCARTGGSVAFSVSAAGVALFAAGDARSA